MDSKHQSLLQTLNRQKGSTCEFRCIAARF